MKDLKLYDFDPTKKVGPDDLNPPSPNPNKPKDKKPYRCPFCKKKSFKTEVALASHIKHKHPVSGTNNEQPKKVPQKVFCCPKCQREFPSKQALADHMRDSHPQPIKQPNPPKVKPPKQPKQKKNKGGIDSEAKLTISPYLMGGRGRYTRGVFKKTTCLNFKLEVRIFNPNNYRITKLYAVIKYGHLSVKKKLAIDEINEIDIETSKLEVTITVYCVYKVGLFSSKTEKATITGTFKP